MSLRSGYKSRGQVNDRDMFEFKDGLGRDPIRSRYAGGDGNQKLMDARLVRSASDAHLATSALQAVTKPVEEMASFFENMNKINTQNDVMQKNARVNAQAVMIRKEMSNVTSVQGMYELQANRSLAEGWADERVTADFNARMGAFTNNGRAEMQMRLLGAENLAEIDKIEFDYPYLVGDDAATSALSTSREFQKRRAQALIDAASNGVYSQTAAGMSASLGEPEVTEPAEVLAGGIAQRSEDEDIGAFGALGIPVPRTEDGAVDSQAMNIERGAQSAENLPPETRTLLMEQYRAHSRALDNSLTLDEEKPDIIAKMENIEQVLIPQRIRDRVSNSSNRDDASEYLNAFKDTLE